MVGYTHLMDVSVEAQRDKGSYLRSWTQEGEELNLGPRSSVFEAFLPVLHAAFCRMVHSVINKWGISNHTFSYGSCTDEIKCLAQGQACGEYSGDTSCCSWASLGPQLQRRQCDKLRGTPAQSALVRDP